MEHEKIRRTLFGKDFQKARHAIITPISSIYQLFDGIQSKGWWSVKEKDKDIIIHGPLGEHIEDAVLFLPNVDDIILVGYCGSMIDLPGAIVTGKIAIHEEKNYPLVPFSDFPTRVLFQVRTLHEQNLERMLTMKQIGIDAVDMETGSVAKIATVPVKTLYVVTDNPLSAQYYNLTQADKDRISRGIEDAVKFIEGAL